MAQRKNPAASIGSGGILIGSGENRTRVAPALKGTSTTIASDFDPKVSRPQRHPEQAPKQTSQICEIALFSYQNPTASDSSAITQARCKA